ncbi:MAG: fibronectin type III domain-containing protein [Clostridia bacterium]|nr:fibronectin type III domain-containing protein [Clostridia bacterium]
MKKVLNLLLVAVLGVSVFSAASLTASAATLPKVTSVKAYNIDDDEINLKWKKVKGADGYQVKIYSKGKWKAVGLTKKTNFEVDDRKSATNYRFKVRTYELKKGKRVYGKYSSVVVAATEPDEVDDVKASAKEKTSVTLKWSKVPRASRYQVYLYDSAKGKYVRKVTVKKNTATVKELKAGTTYKFKVRAYFSGDAGKEYGDYSDVLSVKTKASAAKKTTSGSSAVTRSKAESLALSHAGLSRNQVRDFECELDYERGVKVYEVSFDSGRYDYEYVINAATGKILHWEKERD